MKYFNSILVAISLISLGGMLQVKADLDPSCPYPSENVTFYKDPYNCSLYYECFEGVKYVMNCPTGLYWNDKLKVCDYKDDVECNPIPEQPTSPTPSTSAPTTDPNFTPDPQCPYPSNRITYLDYPEDCHRFYECENGVKYLMTCPNNLYWNHNAQYCDFLENVPNCSPSGSSTSSRSEPTPTETTPKKNPTTPGSSICAGQPDGTLLANPNDCAKYYECVEEEAIEFTCSPGTLWHEIIHTCDQPEHVICP